MFTKPKFGNIYQIMVILSYYNTIVFVHLSAEVFIGIQTNILSKISTIKYTSLLQLIYICKDLFVF